MNAFLTPGQWVRLAEAPQWGIGQVQSVVGMRITVNFVHAGKRLVLADRVRLEPVDRQGEDTEE